MAFVAEILAFRSWYLFSYSGRRVPKKGDRKIDRSYTRGCTQGADPTTAILANRICFRGGKILMLSKARVLRGSRPPL